MNLKEATKPLGVSEFFNQHWGVKPVYIEGEDGKFASLLRWDDLNDIIRHHHLEYPRLRLAKSGEILEQTQFFDHKDTESGETVSSLRLPQVYRQLRDGATLILDSVDDLHEPVSRLSESLEWSFRNPTQVNAYVSCHPTEGFSLHWDDHDVLIFQVHGIKEWEVRAQSRRAPLQNDVKHSNHPPSDIKWKGALTPGDLLYIPRGWWHVAQATGDPTLHLTLGVNKPTGVDLLRWIGDKLKSYEVFRQDLPRFAAEPERESHMSKIKEILFHLWESEAELLDDYFKDRDGRSKPSLSPDLPQAMRQNVLSSSNSISIRATVSCPIEPETGSNDSVQFRCNGKVFQFLPGTKSLVSTLLDGSTHRLSEIYGMKPEDVDTDQVDNMICKLILEGILTLEEN